MAPPRTGEKELPIEGRERPAPAREADVERLAEEFGRIVDRAPEREREELREYAIELVRDETGTARHGSRSAS